MYSFQRVERYRVLLVRCIEVYEVLRSTLWYVPQNILRYVPMWINDAQAVAALNVGYSHIFKQSALARP